MASPSNEDLAAQFRTLKLEVEHLRLEISRLKEPRGGASARGGTDQASISLPQPVRPPPIPAPLPKPIVSGTRRPAASRRWLDEKFVGEHLPQYAGMVVLGIGIIFFLIWTAAHAGPVLRVLIASGAGAALVFGGLQTERRPPYDKLAGTLIGGGWTVLYITAYAAGHFETTRILSSPSASIAALLAVAAGMTVHAVSRRSRALRLYAVGLTYFLMLFCGQETGFGLFILLLAAAAAIAVGTGEADVLAASLIGYYANFVPVYAVTISANADQRTMTNFLTSFRWLAGAYFIVALLPLIPKARRRLFAPEQAKISEAVLGLNSILFGLMGGSMGRVYFGTPTLPRAAVMASAFALPSLLYTRLLSRRSAAAGINAVLALSLLAVGVFAMPDPMWRLTVWIFVSCAWVWVGLYFDQPVWRASGLFMAAMVFGLYWKLTALGGDVRREASMALFVFVVLSYGFARYYRLWSSESEDWEKPAATLWLHAGSLALVLGLWGVLDSAPFLCVLAALAIAGEHAAQSLDRVDLWAQAVVVEFGLGIYSFFVDYGADFPVFGLSPRFWTTLVVLASYAYLYFVDPVDAKLASRWKKWDKTILRRGLSWLAAAVAAFAVYREFDGRLRLPIWALWSLGLYWLGRKRSETHFKEQSLALAVVASVEAVLTYLLYPSELLSRLSAFQIVFYWGACAILLGGLFLAKDQRRGEPSPFDKEAATAFGALPLVLGACWFGKELDRVALTISWTALGLAFVAGGLVFDWRELRWPGLGLLGVCVGKALLFDTANLSLPSRVASFIVLGLVLLLASGLYVRAGGRVHD